MGGLGEAICIKLAALGYQVVTTHSPGNTKVAAWLKGMNNLGYGFAPTRATSPTTIPVVTVSRR
jgi:NAD(P)-dependent dehydrogenase (short-subunit alcohol dehydrogenase family)